MIDFHEISIVADTYPTPDPDLPLLRKVLDHVDAHPEEYDQHYWVSPCGTSYCIAGHALVMSGHTLQAGSWPHESILDGSRVSPKTVAEMARRELGLTQTEGVQLFSEHNTRESVQTVAEWIAKRAGEEL